jgi:hypothetical protein
MSKSVLCAVDVSNGDDDVKTLQPSETEEGEFDEAGARVQWKQFLGVGFAVNF